jgi:hypothetical protein
MAVETWRLFYDNLFDRPDKDTFTVGFGGGSVAGHLWQRSVDGSRNTTFRVAFQPDANSIEWDITWAAGDEQRPVGGQWSVGLFNHNLKLVGCTSIEVEAATTAAGALSPVVEGYFADMPIGPSSPATQDFDYIWLSDQTTFFLPIGRLRVRARFLTGAASAEVRIGQIAVYTGYIETDGGPQSPVPSTIEAMHEFRRTSAGDPSPTPGLSQSQMVNLNFPVQSHDQFDLFQKLIMMQRQGLPYAIHPHAVPDPNGLWKPSSGSDEDVEGKGMAWLVNPTRSRLTYLTDDRYAVRLAGLRQKGLDQWV